MQQGVIEEEVDKRGHEEWSEKKEGIRRKRLKGQKKIWSEDGGRGRSELISVAMGEEEEEKKILREKRISVEEK